MKMSSYVCVHMKIDSLDGDRKFKLLPAKLNMNYKLIFCNSPIFLKTFNVTI